MNELEQMITRVVVEIDTLNAALGIGRIRSREMNWSESRQGRVSQEIRKEALETIDRLVTEYVLSKTEREEQRMTDATQAEETTDTEETEVPIIGMPEDYPEVTQEELKDDAFRTQYMTELHAGLIAIHKRYHPTCAHADDGPKVIVLQVLGGHEDVPLDPHPSIFWPNFGKATGVTFMQGEEGNDDWSLVFVSKTVDMFCAIKPVRDTAVAAEVAAELISELAKAVTKLTVIDQLMKVFGE